jgi:hypothetical protein
MEICFPLSFNLISYRLILQWFLLFFIYMDCFYSTSHIGHYFFIINFNLLLVNFAMIFVYLYLNGVKPTVFTPFLILVIIFSSYNMF